MERGLYLDFHPNGSRLWRDKYRYLGKQKGTTKSLLEAELASTLAENLYTDDNA